MWRIRMSESEYLGQWATQEASSRLPNNARPRKHTLGVTVPLSSDSPPIAQQYQTLGHVASFVETQAAFSLCHSDMKYRSNQRKSRCLKDTVVVWFLFFLEITCLTSASVGISSSSILGLKGVNVSFFFIPFGNLQITQRNYDFGRQYKRVWFSYQSAAWEAVMR